MSKVIPENSTPLENSSGQNEVKRSLKAEFTDSVDSVQIYPPLHDESMESRMHPGIEGEWEDDSMLKDLLSMVDMGEWRQQRNIDQQQKENKRYQSVSGKKERLIERFSQEKIKTPSEDKQNERKRNKSISKPTNYKDKSLKFKNKQTSFFKIIFKYFSFNYSSGFSKYIMISNGSIKEDSENLLLINSLKDSNFMYLLHFKETIIKLSFI